MINKFLIVLFCLLINPHAYGDLSKAEQSYKEQDYSDASQNFLEMEIKEPENLKHSYNRAVSQFKEKKYKEAASGFMRSAESQDKNLASKSLFNLGNSQIAQGALEDAVKSFEKVLDLDKENEKAAENLQWTKKRIEELKKQQQNKDQQNKDQQNQDQQNKDQQNQDQQNQDQQNQDQQNQDQQNKDQQNKDQQNQDQQNQDQQNQDQQNQDQQNQDQQNQDQQNQDQQNQDQQNQDQSSMDDLDKGADQDKTPQQEPKPLKDGEITKEAALRMLRSLEDQEEHYGKPIKAPPGSSRPQKDW